MAVYRPWRQQPGQFPGRSRHTQLRGPKSVILNGYGVVLTSPANGSHQNSLSPTIGYTLTITNGQPSADIQVQWSTDPLFRTVNFSQTISSVSPGNGTFHPSTQLTYTTWYIRARAGKVGTAPPTPPATNANWGLFAPYKWLIEYPLLGSATAYIEENITVAFQTSFSESAAYVDENVTMPVTTNLLKNVAYIEENVGLLLTPSPTTAYVTENIIVTLGSPAAAQYIDQYVTTGEPKPVIWWIHPRAGITGYVVDIYGHGFGTDQTTYDGEVLINDLVCTVTEWELVPADPHAANGYVELNIITPPSTSGTWRVGIDLAAMGIDLYSDAAVPPTPGGWELWYDIEYVSPVGKQLRVTPILALLPPAFQGGSNQVWMDQLGATDQNGYPAGGGYMGDYMDIPATYDFYHREVTVSNTFSNYQINGIGFAIYTYFQPDLSVINNMTIRIRKLGLVPVGQTEASTRAIWVVPPEVSPVQSLPQAANSNLWPATSGLSFSATSVVPSTYEIYQGDTSAEDLISPEHGHITIVIPDSAISGPIKVRLTSG